MLSKAIQKLSPLLFQDQDYYKTLVRIAVPITVQQFITSSLNAVDVMMIGQLGETAVASVGLANQLFFLFTLLMFGISSGGAMFTAQLWGKRDIKNIHKVLGICLTVGLASSMIFAVAAVVFPHVVLSLYTPDPEVVALGSSYLRIVGFSYILTGITFSFAAVLRSTENVRLPMYVSIVALSGNTFMNYLLIFGNLGFPEMGVPGAATATLIARTLECTALVSVTYLARTPVAARIKDLFAFNWVFLQKYFTTALPVIFNESLWSLGITVYNAIYARIGTDAIAAVNISSTIENLAFVLFIGLSNAAAIMIGGRIGAGEENRAFNYARRSLLITIIGAILIGGVIFTGRGLILSLYNVSESTRTFAHYILGIVSFVFWIRVSNMMMIVGILRSGGDTRFSFVLDVGTVWVIGIPLALIGAFVFHLPVYGVMLMIMAEELVKFGVGIFRVRSGRWVHNLSQAMSLT
jgi:putative MATE family efflux protein